MSTPQTMWEIAVDVLDAMFRYRDRIPVSECNQAVDCPWSQHTHGTTRCPGLGPEAGAQRGPTATSGNAEASMSASDRGCLAG